MIWLKANHHVPELKSPNGADLNCDHCSAPCVPYQKSSTIEWTGNATRERLIGKS